MHLLFKKEMVRWRLFRSKLKNMSTKICTCTPGKSICDGNCLYGGGMLPNFAWVFFLIIAFLLAAVINSSAQVPAMYGGGSLMQKMDRIQPTLWKYADGMDTSDSYCIHRMFDSTKTSIIFLIGFNEEGNENMRLRIEEVYYVPTLSICVLYQNGMEIRLREKLF